VAAVNKREYKRKFGFWPHEERCANCGWRRADHTVWNTDRTFRCEGFAPTGEKS
jgi:hypothetical protein